MADAKKIDFSKWELNTLPERTGNVRWQPDLQELIYTAINHVEGDYEDADENAAEQVIERLVLAIKTLLREEQEQPIARLEASRPNDWWVIGKGRTRPDEPLYGIEIMEGQSVFMAAQGEADTLAEAIDDAIAQLGDDEVLS